MTRENETGYALRLALSCSFPQLVSKGLLQDPFEIDFNVARCVTKDGLYTVSCFSSDVALSTSD